MRPRRKSSQAPGRRIGGFRAGKFVRSIRAATTSIVLCLLLGCVVRPLNGKTNGVATALAYEADATAGTADPVRSASSKACRCDVSEHRVRFITVEPGVRLEVLDWGGRGPAMVLLAGLGDNAHVFDQFAYQFNDRFHVIGITRRGFGRSSQPADGYDIDTRARDDLAVLDRLGIRQAIFVGHSIASTELNKLATAYPERVNKLVYLDGLDIGSDGWALLPQPPPAPKLKAADLKSVQRLAAADARDDGFRKPLAAVCNFVRTNSSGRVTGPVTPPEISAKIIAGLEPADYSLIRAPALGIFNRITPSYRFPYYQDLKRAQQRESDRSIQALSKWVARAIDRFRTDVRHARVVELKDTNHYIYIVDESLVVREMREFLLDD